MATICGVSSFCASADEWQTRTATNPRVSERKVMCSPRNRIYCSRASAADDTPPRAVVQFQAREWHIIAATWATNGGVAQSHVTETIPEKYIRRTDDAVEIVVEVCW